jgi:hypothetical protein
MARRGALRLILHGAILLLIGMSVGFPAFLFGPPTKMDDEFRLFFRQSHLIPIATGAWMIAIAGGLPHLSLKDRGASWLIWSLVISAYSLVVAQMAWGAALYVGWTRANGEPVTQSPLAPLYIGSLGVVAAGAIVGTFIIMLGAYSALRQLARPVQELH